MDDQQYKITVSKFVAATYATAGACLAILLSIEDDFRIGHPWTVGLLSAGFPLSILSAFWLDFGDETNCHSPWRSRLACLVALGVGVAGITAYFFEIDRFMWWGFVVGLGAAAAVLPRFK